MLRGIGVIMWDFLKKFIFLNIDEIDFFSIVYFILIELEEFVCNIGVV